MNGLRAALCLTGALLAAGCVTAPAVQKASLRMAWPQTPQSALLAYAAPAPDYPSVGGDVLSGASPEQQARARAAAAAPDK